MKGSSATPRPANSTTLRPRLVPTMQPAVAENYDAPCKPGILAGLRSAAASGARYRRQIVCTPEERSAAPFSTPQEGRRLLVGSGLAAPSRFGDTGAGR